MRHSWYAVSLTLGIVCLALCLRLLTIFMSAVNLGFQMTFPYSRCSLTWHLYTLGRVSSSNEMKVLLIIPIVWLAIDTAADTWVENLKLPSENYSLHDLSELFIINHIILSIGHSKSFMITISPTYLFIWKKKRTFLCLREAF